MTPPASGNPNKNPSGFPEPAGGLFARTAYFAIAANAWYTGKASQFSSMMPH